MHFPDIPSNKFLSLLLIPKKSHMAFVWLVEEPHHVIDVGINNSLTQCLSDTINLSAKLTETHCSPHSCERTADLMNQAHTGNNHTGMED